MRGADVNGVVQENAGHSASRFGYADDVPP